MTLTTRTAAKGIPPKVRSPAGKSKKKATVEKIKEKRKRDDHDEDSEISKPKKRKKKTKQRSKSSESDEEESEVEVVEDSEPVPEEIAVVDDGEVSAMGDEEVSKIRMTCNKNFYSQYSRETGSTNINEGKNLKRSLSKKI